MNGIKKRINPKVITIMVLSLPVLFGLFHFGVLVGRQIGTLINTIMGW